MQLALYGAHESSFLTLVQAMYGSQLLVPGATCSKSSKIYRRIGSEKLRAIEIAPHVWNGMKRGTGRLSAHGATSRHYVNPVPAA